jgi:hypothetical protein
VRNLRELVEEIAVFSRTPRGLNAEDFPGWLAQRPSLNGLTTRDVYYICLGRLPENAQRARMQYPSRHACAAHILECLLTREFRERLPALIFAAFPDLERHFFVHVPRTGGTTLRRLIENQRGLLAWNEGYTQDEWFAHDYELFGKTGARFMLRFLAQFAGPAPATFFYTGHVTLGDLLARRLIRPYDKSLVVVRDPVKMILSAINYILMVARREARTPDAVQWAKWLRELDPHWRSDVEASPELIAKLVSSERFRTDYADMMTRFLSIDGTVEGALAAIEIAHCTVIEITRIDTYARDVLGIDTSVVAQNASTDVIAQTGGVTPELRSAIERMSVRDVDLMRRLRDAVNLHPLIEPA